MTYPIGDAFDEPRGRWNIYAPWDGSEFVNSVKGFLSTQQHIDIRNFHTGEPWTLTGTGLTSLVVGPVSARGGWSGASTLTNGSAVNATFLSSFPTVPLDISSMDSISLILPNYNSFDSATSLVQFTSAADGNFGSNNSVSVFFSSNLSVLPQMRLAVSAFNNTGFDKTKVTGVKITLIKAVAPTGGLTVTIFALRAFVNAWTESALDFDTKVGSICVPVTLDGAPYGGTTAKAFEFIRGDGSPNDPIPIDGAYNMFFFAGGQTSPNDATGSNYNNLSFLLREIKDTGAGTGSYIQTSLLWNDGSVKFQAQRIDITGGSGGTKTLTTLHTETIASSLRHDIFYMFRVQLVGTTITAALYQASLDGSVGDLIWRNTITVTDSAFIFRTGRVGFIADLLTRDSYVYLFESAAIGFAVLKSQVYQSLTPVNGARLAAIFSSDENLFSAWSGSDLTIDPTKTLSGNGSYRTINGLNTNQFTVDDWTNTYLSMAIWVGSAVTSQNQPIIYLNTSSDQREIRIPNLRPNQWNNIEVDLVEFQDLVTGTGYSISVKPRSTPDKSLGSFWLDETLIGRRKVAWSIRATPNGPFREFRSLINRSDGSVHLNPNERGTALQLQAVALTSDAWVSNYKLWPHYAELGNLVYDSSAHS